MGIEKKFNAWIASNFRGLSPHTLRQFIQMQLDFVGTAEAMNMVHVNLFNVFTGSKHDEDVLVYDAVHDMVISCTWL